MPFCKICKKNTTTATETHTGNIVCSECGYVLEEDVIVQEISFEQGGNGHSHMVGTFIGETAHSASFAMRGLFKDTSNFGGDDEYQGSKAVDSHSREMTMFRAKQIILRIAEQLNIPGVVATKAHRVYQLALDKGFTRGRKADLVAAACLYMMCRQDRTAHVLLDFSDCLQYDVFAIANVFMRLKEVLRIDIPLVEPFLYVKRFASQMEFGNQEHAVIQTALKIIASMKRDWMQTGRKPTGLCAAALLVAARIHGFRRTQYEIVRVVRICCKTLSLRLNEFKETEMANMTLDEMESSIDSYQGGSMPPSYKANLEKERTEVENLMADKEFKGLDDEAEQAEKETEKKEKEMEKKKEFNKKKRKLYRFKENQEYEEDEFPDLEDEEEDEESEGKGKNSKSKKNCKEEAECKQKNKKRKTETTEEKDRISETDEEEDIQTEKPKEQENQSSDVRKDSVFAESIIENTFAEKEKTKERTEDKNKTAIVLDVEEGPKTQLIDEVPFISRQFLIVDDDLQDMDAAPIKEKGKEKEETTKNESSSSSAVNKEPQTEKPQTEMQPAPESVVTSATTAEQENEATPEKIKEDPNDNTAQTNATNKTETTNEKEGDTKAEALEAENLLSNLDVDDLKLDEDLLNLDDLTSIDEAAKAVDQGSTSKPEEMKFDFDFDGLTTKQPERPSMLINKNDGPETTAKTILEFEDDEEIENYCVFDEREAELRSMVWENENEDVYRRILEREQEKRERDLLTALRPKKSRKKKKVVENHAARNAAEAAARMLKDRTTKNTPSLDPRRLLEDNDLEDEGIAEDTLEKEIFSKPSKSKKNKNTSSSSKSTKQTDDFDLGLFDFS